ncbi:hypothetical protein LGT41_0013695 [Abyssibius alkaniclasticus]|uniref:hypothetical protein n=1 Tax=Abyssibius alkaniclasticus TaxID=2881234 RepID=UPI0023649F3A|nr:hypothetical protein [Abyssibius alkaniclasticus]UPH70827.1 hypothetical protein LGT41_0013695 [Abyssibius alkaniclasticus]
MRIILTFVFLAFATASLAQDMAVPPFYRGMEKTQTQLAADRVLIERALSAHDGDAVAAGQRWAGMAWAAIGAANAEDAVRRFNQAWLIDPTNPGLAYGLMIATHLRGDDAAVVDGLYAEALAAMPDADRKFVQVDYAQILMQRGDLARAVEVLDPYKTEPEAAALLRHLNQIQEGAGQ